MRGQLQIIRSSLSFVLSNEVCFPLRRRLKIILIQNISHIKNLAFESEKQSLWIFFFFSNTFMLEVAFIIKDYICRFW